MRGRALQLAQMSTFARLISQMQVLSGAYPSSLAVSSAADRMLERSMEKLAEKDLTAAGVVQNTALAFGALSCGASVKDTSSAIGSCRFFLNLEFPAATGGAITNKQTARSVFQYAKWGTLSFLIKLLSPILVKQILKAHHRKKGVIPPGGLRKIRGILIYIIQGIVLRLGRH